MWFAKLGKEVYCVVSCQNLANFKNQPRCQLTSMQLDPDQLGAKKSKTHVTKLFLSYHFAQQPHISGYSIVPMSRGLPHGSDQSAVW